MAIRKSKNGTKAKPVTDAKSVSTEELKPESAKNTESPSTNEASIESPVEAETKNIETSPKSSKDKILEEPSPTLEIVKQPEQLPLAPGLRPVDVQEQRALLQENPEYRQRVQSDLETLGAIVQIIHVKAGPILRQQPVSSIAASNLVCLDKFLKRVRVTSGTNVSFSFPTVNVIVETKGADNNKKEVIDGFTYDESFLAPDPVATIKVSLVFYEGETLKVKTVNALAPVKQIDSKTKQVKTIGYWVLESFEVV